MIGEQKICYMFNKFFSSFIKELKGLDEGLKSIIKKNFKVIDKSSDEYYNLFWGNVASHLKQFVEGDDLATNEEIANVEIVQGITIDDAVKVLKGDDLHTFWNYINILIIFAYLYTEAKSASSEQEDKSETYSLFIKVVKILSMIQNAQDPTSELEDIIDDDIKQLLLKIKVFDSTNDDIKIDDATDALPTPQAEFLKGIENSKIADLAKEISKEIDISNISIEKPEDVAKLMDFSGSNNFLGNIVSKVSTKLTEKISSGEIKQEDLLSEAMSMMSMLNGGGAGGAGGMGGIADILKGMGGLGGLGSMMNNPMMSEMMKMAKKGKVATKNTGGTRRTGGGGNAPVSTRDRLRKKLEEKKQKDQGDDHQQ
jgi:hypothetical protein